METIGGLVAQAAGAALLAKLIVDGIRKGKPNLSGGLTVALAFVMAELGQFGLMATSAATVFDRSTIVAGIIIGIIAWGTAIGSTELQKSVQADSKG